MATIFSHAFVGCTLVSLAPQKLRNKKNYILGGITAMLPDIDYLGFINHIP